MCMDGVDATFDVRFLPHVHLPLHVHVMSSLAEFLIFSVRQVIIFVATLLGMLIIHITNMR